AHRGDRSMYPPGGYPGALDACRTYQGNGNADKCDPELDRLDGQRWGYWLQPLPERHVRGNVYKHERVLRQPDLRDELHARGRGFRRRRESLDPCDAVRVDGGLPAAG